MSLIEGLSGLNAASEQLSVLGKNIANSATVGYKSASVDFTNVLASHLNSANSGMSTQTGGGVLASNVTQSFSQGAISKNTSPLNAAISGQGMFVLKDPVLGNTVYTRNGQFTENSTGYLVNGSGYKVLDITGTAIQLPVSPNDVSPTSTQTYQVDTVAFTSSLSPYGTVTFGGLTYTNTDGSTLTAAEVAAIFTGLSAGDTSTTIAARSAAAVAAGGSANAAISSGIFSGVLGNFNTTTGTVPDTYLGMQLSAATQASAQPIAVTYDSYGPQTTISVSSSGFLTGSDPIVETTTAGTDYGYLNSMAIDTEGNIVGTYSDGSTYTLAQIGVAMIPSNTGLKQVGNDTWMQTSKSGVPVIAAANSLGRGTIVGSALEDSNVNQTTDMVALLAAQQAYQASAQVVKIENQIYQTLIGMNG
ncbi:flagellar hook-basal body complex protein [Polynucleobacter sp. UB-Raua-W9]|uniref:flagellar hook-basal body complex protein n=1 Tax=Polynucleobacter sp. UB-Raua-W9 TaxID=1819736 RepID=UPI001BFE4D40|nr:flagellar hook-basal body complex protein [Polynucleobacter sp. UB-Raua-W9]QWD71782.1 flagellar hook-basal body complex protein [Polynucleobacter sp. UB-Raua-W9]